ncbi:MAG: hypothetical protein IJ999_04925 [Clostridia bacterium]|nr:hypothetical protein [Clostridia bacterium]
MKKSFSIIALLVAMVFVFTACGGPAVPTLKDRWQSGETMEFKISIADKTNVKDFEEEVPTFNKVAGAQVKPDSADGTLRMEVNKVENTFWNFNVIMEIAETYAKSELPSNWKDTLDKAEIPYAENGNSVAITSKMQSMANFGTIYNESSPKYSAKSVTGVMVYYDEEIQPQIAVNDYMTETTYADGKAKTKFNDKTGTVTNREKETAVDVGNDFIFDNEAFLLAIRSVDMEMLKEANTTSLSFFNSAEQKVQGVTVAMSSAEYKLDDNKDELTYRVGVSLDSASTYAYFMYFEQREMTTSASGTAGQLIPKQELVEMNSGYLHFERVYNN